MLTWLIITSDFPTKSVLQTALQNESPAEQYNATSVQKTTATFTLVYQNKIKRCD